MKSSLGCGYNEGYIVRMFDPRVARVLCVILMGWQDENTIWYHVLIVSRDMPYLAETQQKAAQYKWHNRISLHVNLNMKKYSNVMPEKCEKLQTQSLSILLYVKMTPIFLHGVKSFFLRLTP